MNDDALLTAFLQDRDEPCPCCGYSLKGLMAPRCPECNLRLSLRVALSESRQGAFVAGLVGLAVGAGFSGLLVLYMAAMLSMGKGLGPVMGAFAVATIPACVVLGAALVAWVRFRPALTRARPLTRGLLVAGCWLGTAVAFVVFTLMVR